MFAILYLNIEMYAVLKFRLNCIKVIDHGRVRSQCHAYQAHVGTLRATSRGWIKLKSKNPKEHVIIDPNYLETGML